MTVNCLLLFDDDDDDVDGAFAFAPLLVLFSFFSASTLCVLIKEEEGVAAVQTLA